MIINCFRYLGFTSLYDIKVLSLYEYQARMHAYQLNRIDHEYDMHLQAWINHRVTATTEKGKPVYKKFKDFYDYESNLKKIEKPTSKQITNKQKSMAQIAAKINSERG